MKKRKISIFDIFVRFVMLLGICLLLYPTVSSKWNEMHSSRVIAGYAHAVENLVEEDYTQFFEDASEYNANLIGKADRFDLDGSEMQEYNDVLNIMGNGLMAYIEIPKLSIMLPIYHGVSDAVLQVAAGHIPGSSLPVGGAGTHAAISGHRGLTSATLFTYLDSLEVGDMFYIHVLNDTLAYQVDQIDIVLPDEFDLLHIDSSEDYCTLITCTPYGVNSHRLLVRGTRVAYSEDDKQVIKPVGTDNPVARMDMIFFVVGLFGIVVLVAMSLRSWYVKRKKRND